MAVNVPTKVAIEKFSRSELLLWVNRSLQCDFVKVEELCTGAAYCRLMDMLFPYSLNIKRVKLRANLELDYVHNFKMLQACFNKLSVNMDIHIEKLVKGRLQDNLEFLQWFKRFFDANLDVDGAAKARASIGATKSATYRRSAPTLRPPANTPVVKSDRSQAKPVSASFIPPSKPIAEKVQASGDSWDLSTVRALMEDRDFYYSKLCDIEVICHQSGDNGEGLNIQHILAILYATREGYGPPERAGNM